MAAHRESSWFYTVLKLDRTIHRRLLITLLITLLCLLGLMAIVGLLLHLHIQKEQRTAVQISTQHQQAQIRLEKQENDLRQNLPAPSEREHLLQKLIQIAHQTGLQHLDVQYAYPAHPTADHINHIDIHLNYVSQPASAQRFLYEACANIPFLILMSVNMTRSPEHWTDVQTSTHWRLLTQGAEGE